MEEKPVLSVCLVTYNHENYIRECMESFIRQNKSYSFEILVGDDCSDDHTVDILKQEYGDSVTIYQRKKNIGLVANLLDLFLRCKGKYVFDFAGDDYLCDDNALFKMIDFLENHEEYQGVSCWNSVFHAGENKCYYFHNEAYEYSLIEFLSGKEPPCYCGVMRNTFHDDEKNIKMLAMGAKNNEEIKSWLYWLEHGKIFVLHEFLRTYRYVNKENASNYCSNHTELDIFKDYYTDLQLVEKIYGNKYNLIPLKMVWCNKYCVKLSKSAKELISFLKILRMKDVGLLFLYKVYLRLHHYQNPPKWEMAEYLCFKKAWG